MFKKIVGAFFFVMALIALIGVLAGGVVDSIPAVMGAMLPIGMYIFSGIFFFTFDGVYSQPYVKGFQTRGKQNTMIVISMVVYFLFFLITCVSVAAAGGDNYLLDVVTKCWAYFVPFMIFATCFSLYVVPYMSCKKNVLNTPAAVEGYLSANQQYYSFSQTNKVLANEYALFLPRAFCVIPYQQLQTVKHVKQLGEEVVYFYLTNGKKISISTRQYQDIAKALQAYQQFR